MNQLAGVNTQSSVGKFTFYYIISYMVISLGTEQNLYGLKMDEIARFSILDGIHSLG